VSWQSRAGIFRRDLGDGEHAEIAIAERVYKRTISPIAVAHYVDVTVIAAWCELRQYIRHFRADRIDSVRVLNDRFTSESARLTALWMALTHEGPEPAQ
jgi:predicted DNA-binding transcriptional regulator YafY